MLHWFFLQGSWVPINLERKEHVFSSLLVDFDRQQSTERERKRKRFCATSFFTSSFLPLDLVDASATNMTSKQFLSGYITDSIENPSDDRDSKAFLVTSILSCFLETENRLNRFSAKVFDGFFCPWSIINWRMNFIEKHFLIRTTKKMMTNFKEKNWRNNEAHSQKYSLAKSKKHIENKTIFRVEEIHVLLSLVRQKFDHWSVDGLVFLCVFDQLSFEKNENHLFSLNINETRH